MDCSFGLKSKLFMLRRCGGGIYYIVEKNRRFSNSLYLSRDVLTWFIQAMEDCVSPHNNRTSFQTKRDGNRVLLTQRCQNNVGRFIKLLELGTGKGKGIIAILEGANGKG